MSKVCPGVAGNNNLCLFRSGIFEDMGREPHNVLANHRKSWNIRGLNELIEGVFDIII